MNRAQRWLPRLIYVPLALVPFVYLVIMVIHYGIDIPDWDEWRLLPLLQKLSHHRLAFSDLWAQENEHRLIFPKIVMLVLARMSSWNIRWELAANLVLAFATFALLVGQIEATGKAIGERWIALVIPAISVQFFSFRQFENWLWGWQLQMFLNLLASVGSILLLANPPFRWSRFVAAALLAIVAVYSFASGMLMWPIGVVLLALAPHYRGRLRWKCLALWCAVGAATAASYLHGYHRPPKHPALDHVFGDPGLYMDYVRIYLGSLASSLVDPAREAGMVIAIVTPVAMLLLVRLRRVQFGLLLPYLGMCLYVFGNALVTGVARSGFGADQALASRYNVYGALLWSCNLVFVMMLVLAKRPPEQAADAGHTRKLDVRRKAQSAVSVLALLTGIWILVQTTQASIEGVNDFTKLSALYADGRDQVVRSLNWSVNLSYEEPILYESALKMPAMAKIMAREHWSVFRNGIPKNDDGDY